MPGRLHPAKLLRVLETSDYTRVGGTTRSANIRVIAATNRCLEDEGNEGRFRKDLRFRLAVLPITVPPLREHLDDIPALVSHFLARWAEVNKRNPPTVHPGTIPILSRHNWPGNVRELRNVVLRVAARARGGVVTEEIMQEALQIQERPRHISADQKIRPLEEVVAEAERAHIAWVLVRMGWRRGEAADVLKIDRKTLYEKMNRYGITEPDK